MLSRHSAAIAASFGARAAAYEQHAGLQRSVADRLAGLLPELNAPRVLELGCGTGLFSRHLLARYPDGRFVLSDLSAAMLSECRRNIAVTANGHVNFEVMDAGRAGARGPFDLIAMSMALHWFANPLAALADLRRSLAPDGTLIYATLGPDSFAEWRDVLQAEKLGSGLAEIVGLPGIVDEERVAPDESALGFLRRMKSVGGLTPREGYARLTPGALRRAIRAADARHGGRITWHIVYGRLEAQAESRSRPSIIPA